MRIINHQTDFVEWLYEQPAAVRGILLWLIPALVGYFVPMTLVAMTGRWQTSITDPYGILLGIGILLVETALGVAFRRPWIVAGSLCVVSLIYFGQLIARTETWSSWMDWWMSIVVPPVTLLLNTLVFERLRNKGV
jgi:hypothetical protein